MHVHIGVAGVLITFGSVLIAGFFWRTLAGLLKDSPVGKAMSFLY